MKWLGSAAVLWVMDEAPDVPPHLFAALVAVARYADEDGRGAYPSALTVAAIIRKSERAAKKDLAALRRLGLLLPGDQRIVKDIRADKRPFVYDLPMPRGVAQDTPPGSHGVSHRVKRGVAQGHSGVSHTTPKESLRTPRSGASSRGSAGATPHGAPGKSKSGQDKDSWMLEGEETWTAAQMDAWGRTHPGANVIGPDSFARKFSNNSEHLHICIYCRSRRPAPPCAVCGRAFSPKLLADPEFRALALAGNLMHSGCRTGGPICPECETGNHPECMIEMGYCGCPEDHCTKTRQTLYRERE